MKGGAGGGGGGGGGGWTMYPPEIGQKDGTVHEYTTSW